MSKFWSETRLICNGSKSVLVCGLLLPFQILVIPLPIPVFGCVPLQLYMWTLLLLLHISLFFNTVSTTEFHFVDNFNIIHCNYSSRKTIGYRTSENPKTVTLLFVCHQRNLSSQVKSISSLFYLNYVHIILFTYLLKLEWF